MTVDFDYENAIQDLTLLISNNIKNKNTNTNAQAAENHNQITNELVNQSSNKVDNLLRFIDYNSQNIIQIQEELTEKETFNEIAKIFNSTIFTGSVLVFDLIDPATKLSLPLLYLKLPS